MSKCGKCNKNFKTGACKIGCEFCSKWYHIDCEEVSKEVWKVMSESKQIHWFCKKCNEKAEDVLAVVKKCVKENEEIKRELKDLQQTVKDIKEGKDEEFIESVKKIIETVVGEKQSDNPVRNPSREVIREIAKKEVQENNDKKGRECNFVVSGIDEEDEAENEIQDMLNYLEVTVDVSGIRRMGRDKIAGKTRQVWVKVASKIERNNVIDRAKKLKEEDKWKRVYINRDMTEAERKEAFEQRVNRNMTEAEKAEPLELKVELRKRRNQEARERGTNRYTIQGGQVIRQANEREPATEDGIQVEEEEGH